MSWELNGQKLSELDQLIEYGNKFHSKYCKKCKFEWKCNKIVILSVEGTLNFHIAYIGILIPYHKKKNQLYHL